MEKSQTGSDITSFDRQAILAERRVNIVRATAIFVFYAIHFLRVSAPQLQSLAPALEFDVGSPVPQVVHFCVSVLCFGWLMQCFVVFQKTSSGEISPWLSTYVTIGDLCWLTALLCLSSGPGSPIVSGYFLIILLTGIRFDLRLTRIATVVAGLSYLFLIGVARWPFGLLREIPIEKVSRFHQATTLVAIILSGIIVGQIVRHAYQIGRQKMLEMEKNRRGTESVSKEAKQ